MYRQPNHSYTSSDSLRRLSSNNPFRIQQQQQQQQQQQPKYVAPQQSNRSNNSVSSPSNFEDWVEKNKQLIEISSDEDEPYRPVDMSLNMKDTTKNNSGDLARPVFPHKPVRADSDSSVNYGYVFL